MIGTDAYQCPRLIWTPGGAGKWESLALLMVVVHLLASLSIVGEEGQELFIPDIAGTIVSNPDLFALNHEALDW